VRVGIIAMVANMFLNVAFVAPWVYFEFIGPHAGLALATAISAFLNAGLLYRHLRRAEVYTPRPGWLTLLRQIAIAGAVLCITLVALTPELTSWQLWSITERGLALAGLILLGAGVYILSLLIQGARPNQFLSL